MTIQEDNLKQKLKTILTQANHQKKFGVTSQGGKISDNSMINAYVKAIVASDTVTVAPYKVSSVEFLDALPAGSLVYTRNTENPRGLTFQSDGKGSWGVNGGEEKKTQELLDIDAEWTVVHEGLVAD